jgi:hypothetical protein
MTDHQIEIAKLVVSVVGLGGTLGAAILALRTFQRNEAWKRAEFLAREMKEFLANERVQKALLLIDWGSRRIRLLDGPSPDHGWVRVTRSLQVRALLPHTLLNAKLGSDVETDQTSPGQIMRRYSPEEAAIRDCYDAFLDGLERFASYVKTGLIDVGELRPYLAYWIDDIHAPTKDADDAAWCAALLTYIEFYRFQGVQWLFYAFHRDIAPDSESFRSFVARMADRTLAAKFIETVQKSAATSAQ